MTELSHRKTWREEGGQLSDLEMEISRFIANWLSKHVVILLTLKNYTSGDYQVLLGFKFYTVSV